MNLEQEKPQTRYLDSKNKNETNYKTPLSEHQQAIKEKLRRKHMSLKQRAVNEIPPMIGSNS